MTPSPDLRPRLQTLLAGHRIWGQLDTGALQSLAAQWRVEPMRQGERLLSQGRLHSRLGLVVEGGLQPQDSFPIGNVGRLDGPMTADEFASHVESVLGRQVLHIGDTQDEIETLAWCTGAAQGFIDQAQALGVDAYLSGEISEPTTHFARETGIHYFACGHHATERYGVQALGEWLADEYGLEHTFIDIDNPV